MTLIGPAARFHRTLTAKCARHITSGDPLRLFFSGEPGTGKSTVAALLARQLARHELGIQKINGADVGAETVREWGQGAFTGSSMFSDWRVLIIEEADRVSAQAQVLMLTLLDDLPKQRAVICTSNLATQDLTARFQTRFQLWEFKGPESGNIFDFLSDKFPDLPASICQQIATASNGNVRQALLDAESAADAAAA